MHNLLQCEGLPLGTRSLQNLQKWQFGSHLVSLSKCYSAGVLSCWVLGRAWRCHRGSDELFIAETYKGEECSCTSSAEQPGLEFNHFHFLEASGNEGLKLALHASLKWLLYNGDASVPLTCSGETGSALS